MSKDVKMIALVAAGVMLAGFVINEFRGKSDIVKRIHDGFDGAG